MKGPSSTPSDVPYEDLKKERDAFVQQFFRKGAQLTEELLRENERLRERIDELSQEVQALRHHLASDNAMRELLGKIEALEKEKRELLSRTSASQAATDQYSERYQEVEGELAHLANLHIATSELVRGRSVRQVLRILKELLAQLLGAGAFAVYHVTPDGGELVALASEGVPASAVARLIVSESAVGRAFLRGEIKQESVGDTSKGTLATPAAVIPLDLDGSRMGAIAIFATLPQKTEWVQADTELFRILSQHAAAALVHAKLYSDARGALPGLAAYLDQQD